LSTHTNDPIFDLFVFETLELAGQLEEIAIDGEKRQGIGASVDEIFRVMHTIKGSSAMMQVQSIGALAHSMEDLFAYIRGNRDAAIDDRTLCDLILGFVDFVKCEIAKLEDSGKADGDSGALIARIREHLDALRRGDRCGAAAKAAQTDAAQRPDENETGCAYRASVFFEEGCQMENIRAFEVVHRLGDAVSGLRYEPQDIMDNDKSAEAIREKGFHLWFRSNLPREALRGLLLDTLFIRELSFCPDGEADDASAARIEEADEARTAASLTESDEPTVRPEDRGTPLTAVHRQSMISVSTQKLDLLMDLVGELVISQAMVLQNPEFKRLDMESLRKDASQLEKITGELRDIVMSIRMVPLSVTFQRMNRIVRDMSMRLHKKVELRIVGEHTEVDKNIIEQISDPLMHIIRNSVDHGLETSEERIAAGKSETGVITLEAGNAGGDVWITVRDDGRGLDRGKILAKARREGLIDEDTEYADKDIWALIFNPGFSTNETASEYSGRGVGMDVVSRNIAQLGGIVTVDSRPGEGTDVTIRIPLTLAIIDGMLIQVGKTIYTIPTVNVQEFFRHDRDKIITDTSGNEMLMIRRKCYPLVRLNRLFGEDDGEAERDGIVIMVEDGEKSLCLLADELLGQQQVVIKSLPEYLRKVRGISGCTLLGDGTISLILDIATLCDHDMGGMSFERRTGRITA
jgi:two-component system chemotaxis sensor kinase CheA